MLISKTRMFLFLFASCLVGVFTLMAVEPAYALACSTEAVFLGEPSIEYDNESGTYSVKVGWYANATVGSQDVDIEVPVQYTVTDIDGNIIISETIISQSNVFDSLSLTGLNPGDTLTITILPYEIDNLYCEYINPLVPVTVVITLPVEGDPNQPMPCTDPSGEHTGFTPTAPNLNYDVDGDGCVTMLDAQWVWWNCPDEDNICDGLTQDDAMAIFRYSRNPF